MNVSDQFEKVRVFLANDRFVTALKNMSGLAMPFIKILAVGLLQPLHEFRQWLFGTLNQQMDVVGPPTIRRGGSVSRYCARQPADDAP